MSAIEATGFIYSPRYPLREPLARVHAYVRDTYSSSLPCEITPLILEVIKRIAVAVIAPFAYLLTGFIALFSPLYSVDHPKLNWDAFPKSIVILSTQDPQYHPYIHKLVSAFSIPISFYYLPLQGDLQMIKTSLIEAKDKKTLVILDPHQRTPRYFNRTERFCLVEPINKAFPHIEKVIVCYHHSRSSLEPQEVLRKIETQPQIEAWRPSDCDSFWTSFKEIYTYHMDMRSPYAQEKFLKALNLTTSH